MAEPAKRTWKHWLVFGLLATAACVLLPVLAAYGGEVAGGLAQPHVIGAAQTVGSLATVGALLMALWQLRQQRASADAQSESAKEQAELQRDAIAEQQRALQLQQVTVERQRDATERAIAAQQRMFELGRLADLRREYARLLGAAYNVALSTMPEPAPFIRPSFSVSAGAFEEPEQPQAAPLARHEGFGRSSDGW